MIVRHFVNRASGAQFTYDLTINLMTIFGNKIGLIL